MGCNDWVLGRKMTVHLCKEEKWSSLWSSNVHNGIVFSDPRFVSAHLIPESDNPEDDKIYFFFRENAIDGEHTGKATHARIGQICKVRWWLLGVILNALASNFINCFLACELFGVNIGIVLKQGSSQEKNSVGMTYRNEYYSILTMMFGLNSHRYLPRLIKCLQKKVFYRKCNTSR